MSALPHEQEVRSHRALVRHHARNCRDRIALSDFQDRATDLERRRRCGGTMKSVWLSCAKLTFVSLLVLGAYVRLFSPSASAQGGRLPIPATPAVEDPG